MKRFRKNLDVYNTKIDWHFKIYLKVRRLLRNYSDSRQLKLPEARIFMFIKNAKQSNLHTSSKDYEHYRILSNNNFIAFPHQIRLTWVSYRLQRYN